MKKMVFIFGVLSLAIFLLNGQICKWQYPDYHENWALVGDSYYLLREKMFSLVFLLLSSSLVVSLRGVNKIPFVALSIFCAFDVYDKVILGVTRFTESDYVLIVSTTFIILYLSIKMLRNARGNKRRG